MRNIMITRFIITLITIIINISKAARGGQYKLGRAWVVFADAFARALVGKYGKKWVAFLHA